MLFLCSCSILSINISNNLNTLDKLEKSLFLITPLNTKHLPSNLITGFLLCIRFWVSTLSNNNSEYLLLFPEKLYALDLLKKVRKLPLVSEQLRKSVSKSNFLESKLILIYLLFQLT